MLWKIKNNTFWYSYDFQLFRIKLDGIFLILLHRNNAIRIMLNKLCKLKAFIFIPVFSKTKFVYLSNIYRLLLLLYLVSFYIFENLILILKIENSCIHIYKDIFIGIMLYTYVYLFFIIANIIKIYNYVRCSVRVESRKETSREKKAFNSEKF